MPPDDGLHPSTRSGRRVTTAGLIGELEFWIQHHTAEHQRVLDLIAAREKGWEAMTPAQRSDLAWAVCWGFEGCDFRDKACRRCQTDAKRGDLDQARHKATAALDWVRHYQQRKARFAEAPSNA